METYLKKRIQCTLFHFYLSVMITKLLEHGKIFYLHVKTGKLDWMLYLLDRQLYVVFQYCTIKLPGFFFPTFQGIRNQLHFPRHKVVAFIPLKPTL